MVNGSIEHAEELIADLIIVGGTIGSSLVNACDCYLQLPELVHTQ